MNTNDNQTGDALAERTFTPTSGSAHAEGQAQAQAAEQEAAARAQQDAAMQALQRGMQSFILKAFKVARAVIARKLPEIREEWTDEVLEEPAAAAVPLVGGYLQGLMAIVGARPELAAFVLSLLPLVLGYITALDRHQRTIDASAGDGQVAAT